MIKVVHVITDLQTGGAQMMLRKLLSGMDRRRFSSEVVTLVAGGGLEESMRTVADGVCSVDMRRGVPNPIGLVRLARLFRRIRPDIVQTWMHHADLLGGVASRLSNAASVCWNIRSSDYAMNVSGAVARLTLRACAVLSHRVPARIICCSNKAARLHVAAGYDGSKFTIIPNGFDLREFAPGTGDRNAVRQELGIASDAFVIGLVARFHSMKDHAMFVRAAALIRAAAPHVQFVLCGDGVDSGNAELRRWIVDAGLESCTLLLGRRNDVARLNSAMDLACSSSAYGEGFSNTVGEAMASGVPCVVTDVGDSSELVGDCGMVVPPRDPAKFADACLAIVNMPASSYEGLRQCARQRIRECFEISDIVRRYEDVYEAVAAGRA